MLALIARVRIHRQRLAINILVGERLEARYALHIKFGLSWYFRPITAKSRFRLFVAERLPDLIVDDDAAHDADGRPEGASDRAAQDKPNSASSGCAGDCAGIDLHVNGLPPASR